MNVRLRAADGHELDAYRAEPRGASAGGIVLIQEIFGVTAHIRRVADQYAAAGFTVVAPAMFDRIERGIELDYSEIAKGRGYMQRLDWRNTLADVQAAVESLAGERAVAVLGYCWGGTVAHVAAAELDLDAAVAYYGGAIARMLDRRPKCPIMYHFGERDHAIPPEDVEKIRAAVPDGVFHVYPGAEHGFNCDERKSYSAADAKLAFERSVAFLREHMGKA
ncbi:MAG TPA: dienelactone hydrolase family protein [Gammaproteobacteria bacterium]